MTAIERTQGDGVRRNTGLIGVTLPVFAGTLCLSAMLLLADDPEATMVMMPADHLIHPAEAFQQAIRQAAEGAPAPARSPGSAGYPPPARRRRSSAARRPSPSPAA